MIGLGVCTVDRECCSGHLCPSEGLLCVLGCILLRSILWDGCGLEHHMLYWLAWGGWRSGRSMRGRRWKLFVFHFQVSLASLYKSSGYLLDGG